MIQCYNKLITVANLNNLNRSTVPTAGTKGWWLVNINILFFITNFGIITDHILVLLIARNTVAHCET